MDGRGRWLRDRHGRGGKGALTLGRLKGGWPRRLWAFGRLVASIHRANRRVTSHVFLKTIPYPFAPHALDEHRRGLHAMFEPSGHLFLTGSSALRVYLFPDFMPFAIHSFLFRGSTLHSYRPRDQAPSLCLWGDPGDISLESPWNRSLGSSARVVKKAAHRPVQPLPFTARVRA